MRNDSTPASGPSRSSRPRRRVYVTAGLSASAAVLAMSMQAAAQADDAPPVSYGDSPFAGQPDDEPDQADQDDQDD